MKKSSRGFLHVAVAGTALAFLVIAPARVLGADAPSNTLNVAQVEGKIRGYMDEGKTVGMAVVMVKGDKIVYQRAFGYRDKDTREPLDINDIFRIASISKSFSGMSIMQLVEAGKMSLEDDINGILGMNIRNPRYPDVPITVKMLLSHTSSMQDGGGFDMYRDLTYVDESKTDKKTIREKAWLPYPPGKGYKYCNRGLNIIGLVIEKVSGERWGTTSIRSTAPPSRRSIPTRRRGIGCFPPAHTSATTNSRWRTGLTGSARTAATGRRPAA